MITVELSLYPLTTEYTPATSNSELYQGSGPDLTQVKPSSKQLNSKELSDADGVKDGAKLTQVGSEFEVAGVYKPAIRDLIKRLKSHNQLKITTNATSTQIVGEHADVFSVLSKETNETFRSGEYAIVMKILSFERDIESDRK